MNRKKVLILGKLPPPFMGPSIGTQIMLNSSLNDDFELLHLDTKANYQLKTLGEWSFYKVFKNWAIYLNLASLIIRKRPDLIMIPVSQTTLGYIKDSIFLIIARIFRRKIILHFLGGEFKQWVEKSSAITRLYVKLTLRLTKGVIVLGSNLQYLFEAYFPDNSIFVIPNGANYKIPPAIPSENNTLRILYLSNLAVSKGFEDVIEAINILKKELKEKIVLNVIGSWTNDKTKKDCLKKITENELPIVFFTTGISNEVKLEHLSKTDIFVFTPRESEGQPWVIVEALATGLPIISTDSGAITEAVKEGYNGFIVPKYAPQQIAEKIKYLMQYPDVAKTMGENSRKSYLERYTEDKMVKKLRDCFNKIIAA